MKAVLATCVALSLVASLAGEASAAAKRKQKHYSNRDVSTKTYGYRAGSGSYDSNATPAWYPHDSSQLPFGSKMWWEQKGRETGGGGDRN
jgi:hypothetical protein